MSTSTIDNVRAFTSWFLSCGLALALIVAAFGVMYPAHAAPDEEKMRQFAESYYKAVAAGDDMAMAQHLSWDTLFRFEMDFGFLYPDYEVEFRANDEEGFDDTMFEGYEVHDTRYSIDAIELTADGAIIRATLLQSYTWSGSQGEMSAKETLTIATVEGAYRITEMESLQEYD